MIGANRWGQLDHIRALAALLVFTWHFTHESSGYPVRFEGAPAFPGAALFDEGHVGVSLFMALSGYLFAKLLHGRTIIYHKFVAARVVRLFPLLALVFILQAMVIVRRNGDLIPYARTLIEGFVLPVWPNGGWSITAELHFYLLLPFILNARRQRPWALLLMLALSVTIRAVLHMQQESVQSLSYFSIVGRIDQFLLGILAFDLRGRMQRRHMRAASAMTIFCGGYYAFDAAGGFYALDGEYPSSSPLWIVWPLFEGSCSAALVAWYDNSFAFRGRIATAVAFVGFVSYEIYLLHFFVFKQMAHAIDQYVMPLNNFYVAWAWAVPCFMALVIPCWIVFKLVEQPWQRFKPDYFVRNQ